MNLISDFIYVFFEYHDSHLKSTMKIKNSSLLITKEEANKKFNLRFFNIAQ